MNHDYWVDWLTPRHAAQAARLERKVYPKDYCAGYHSIRGDLRTAETSGRNLSMGVFSGNRLVGFILAFHELDRARVCEYIDVEPPQGIDLNGPGIYFNDFVVHPDHRGAGALMALRLTQVVRVRDDLRDLPIDTFSTNTMTDTWSQKVKYLKRMSIEIAERVPLQVSAGGEELFWIVFRHVSPPDRARKLPALSSRLKLRRTFEEENRQFQIGTITSVSDWSALAPFWNALLERSSAATVFQTYDYLTTWWSLLGLKNELFITVILLDEQPVVIAPMQISRAKSLGRDRRCLSFIGHPSEVDRNTILVDERGSGLIGQIANYYIEQRDRWDFVALFEQPPGCTLLAELSAKLRRDKFIVTEVPGPECAVVDMRGTWEQFLARKPKAFRKSVKRRLAKLESTSAVSIESLHDADPDSAGLALERYHAIESASWKREAALGVGKSASHRSFFRQIVRTFAAAGRTTFSFLAIGGKDAAGTFGLQWARTFYSLHIAHDEALASLSPGVALTALEMKSAFATKRYDTFDFLGGFMSNKRSWATSTTPTIALFAHPRSIHGWLFHSIHFRMRPLLRHLLFRTGLLEVALNTRRWVQRLLRAQ